MSARVRGESGLGSQPGYGAFLGERASPAISQTQRSLLYIMSIWELEEERTEATKVTRCASLLAIAQVIEVSTASGSTGE